MKRQRPVLMLAVLLCLTAAGPVQARAQESSSDPNIKVDPELLGGLQYRQLDFARGGRSTAVAGVAGKPWTFYFGSTGGGVWKTEDAGLTWNNISDGFFEAASIGAIAVADSDPNVIYVGTGSACPRGNVSPGIGVYRSTDAGKTWKHIGLREAGQIGKVLVDPRNPDIVYVAALGHIFGPNQERGVYRSNDGGRTWEKVLFVSDRTGAVDLSMDPNNPREIYAAMWTVERKPWSIDSGSEESGLYKTTDGGDTWKKLGGGLPSGVVGKIGVAVSPADPERVWALVEAPEKLGGLYRSEDGGGHWRQVNRERRFVQRAWYYIHVFADPKDPETVYVLNTGFYRSTDGGSTFQSFPVPHGDNHDLWINPVDPWIMINANDGGANVSLNGARSWTGQMNQPTSEIYRVTVDGRFPYRVYGAQQDNSTVSVSSRRVSGEGAGFYDVGGGESGYIAVDQVHPNIVYAGSYGGVVTRTDTDTGLGTSVMPYPESSTGQRAADMKYRFQWNAPIRISPHDHNVVYTCSQYVHRSTDAGHSWEVISPDLTRNDRSKQDYSGKPISRDNTGVEVYDTIFAFEESPLVKGLLWAGSDDGMVHISRDNGKTWKDVTPAGMPEFGTVNMIDLSAQDPGRAFIAVYRYRRDDFRPYIFRTNDYGATWDLLTDGTNGIPADHFIRVVREDPVRKGLLFAGGEFGMYISFDDGAHWQSFQQNLPVAPVADLLVYRNDLVVATHGRSFWILDDLTPLRQIDEAAAQSPAHLFIPAQAYRAEGYGATIYYSFAKSPKDPVTLEILDSEGKPVRKFTARSSSPGEERGPEERSFGRYGRGRNLTAKAGLSRFVWDITYDEQFTIPRGTVLWGGSRSGPKAVPGDYQVRLTVGDWSETRPLKVVKDPRVDATEEDFRQQFDLASKVGAKIKELYDSLAELRDVRSQATALGRKLEQAGYGKEAAEAAKALAERLTKIEGELTQLQGEGGQDALNFPGKLDNQFVALYNDVARSERRPTAGDVQRFEDIGPQLASLQKQLKEILDKDLAAFNKLVRNTGAPPIIVKAEP